jgi:Cd2+/Zn2+-exporting ATPase
MNNYEDQGTKMRSTEEENQQEMEHKHEHEHRGHTHEHTQGGLIPLVVAGIILVVGIYMRFIYGPSLISNSLLIAVMILSGYEIAFMGLRALFFGDITINLLVTIAAIGALAIGHIEEGASVLFLFNIAERLEEYATDRARHAIKALMDLRPEIAIIQREEKEIEVPVDQVLPGERFIVRPGDRIPLDGKVIEGNSTVNQATITGESSPISKGIGEELYAGTINIDGFLIAETTKMAEETVLAKILNMVEEAEERKSPTEAFVDRFSRWYTPAVILLALAVATLPPLLFRHSFNHWIYRSLVLLVVACPCALAIATPVAMVSSITSASRNGVLVKGSNYIEQISDSKVFAFDKTGTLTLGELEVVDVISFTLSEEEVLRRAVALEAKSTHPIAKAILDRAEEVGIDIEDVTDFRSYVGRGVEACIDERTCVVGNLRLFQELSIKVVTETVRKLEAEGKTVILVAEEGKIVGALTLMDKIRIDALNAVEDLKSRGIHVEMLTGDNEAAARIIAAKLGVNGFKADLLPEEKVFAIEKLKALGTVVMVGDGVNDAPALAAADVGIAMGAMGSDVALETADIALMEDDLSRIDYALKLGKSTMSRVKENIAISLLVKLAVAALAFPGIVTLWLAVAIGDAGLSLVVVLNSMRLGTIKAKSR